LNVGQTVSTQVPTLRFDPPIPPGTYEYQLVVVDVLDVPSPAAVIRIVVQQG
jgi:hypothetical protein